MAGLSFTWTLRYQGWAFCAICDDCGQAEAIASDITDGPEQLLRAVTAIAQGAGSSRAEFEGEPTAFRWFLRRDETSADIRLVKAADRDSPDSDGSVIWSGRHSVGSLARAILAGFDQAISDLGETAYRAQWGRPFPRSEVEALRTAAQQFADRQHTEQPHESA
jgi:hypothetical protein